MIENMKNNLLNNKDNSDVIFEFKNQKCIYGHKIIL